MRVKEVMTAGIRITEPDEAIPRAAKKMLRQNIGALAVVENSELIGIITDRDIAIRAFVGSDDPASLKVRDVMSDECFVCKDNDSLEDAVRTMQENMVRRLPVLNKKREIVGMLSIDDVASHAPARIAAAVLKVVARQKDSVAKSD